MLPVKLLFTYFVITFSTSFNFGFHTGVINAPLELIRNFTEYVVNERQLKCDSDCIRIIVSICVSAFVIGGFIGTVCGGLVANKFGRKISLFIFFIPTILGSILMMFSLKASSFEMIIFGRFIVGISCGAYTVIGPAYLSEVAPISSRGAAGILNQLMIIISLLISQILGLHQLLGKKEYWPYLLGLCGPICILQIIFVIFIPESPSYLYLIKGNYERAELVLKSLRGKMHNVEVEILELEKEKHGTVSKKAKICELFSISYLRWALFVALVPHFSQQLSGVNGILYYSVRLFTANGLSADEASYANLGVGCTILVGTIISIFIIDRIGRRILLLTGLSICLSSLILFTFALVIKNETKINWFIYVSVVMIFTFIFGFSIGPGSIPWFVVAEMFTQENRDAAVSITGGVNWFCNTIVGLIFPELMEHIGIYAYLPFIAILLIVIILLALYLPETKGRTPVSVEEELKRRTPRICLGKQEHNY